MAERRGLGQAMNLSPDKLAFITGRTTTVPAGEPPAVAVATASVPEQAVSERGQEASDDGELPETTTSGPVAPKPRRPNRQRNTPTSRHDDLDVATEPAGLCGSIKIPLTIRLNPQTADALRRACLEQKLARRTPNSQQEIAEIAISGWLRDQGHL